MPTIENLINSRRCERRPLEKINNRRSECRALKICLIVDVVNVSLYHPISKHINLIIFLKLAFEFGFLFLKALLPYKTPISSHILIENLPVHLKGQWSYQPNSSQTNPFSFDCLRVLTLVFSTHGSHSF